MDDDNDKVIEITDKNEVQMLKTQVGSYGHKPTREIHGGADVNKTTQELGQETKSRRWYSKKTKMRLLVVLPLLIYTYEVALKLLPNT